MKYSNLDAINSISIDGAGGGINQVIGIGESGLTWLDVTNRLIGENFVFVHSKGTSIENGNRLRAAYTAASEETPNGAALSATNRMTIGVMAGYYYMSDPGTNWVIDTPYVDISSLSGECDVILQFGSEYGIRIFTDNIAITGINCNIISIETGDENSVYTNCRGGDDGFFTGAEGSNYNFGTYIDCVGGRKAFGGDGEASGTYIRCTGGDYSFGGGGTATGTFIDCVGGDYSFGAEFREVSGVAGTFIRCKGGYASFVGSITGNLYYCKNGGDFSSATIESGARVIWCIDESGAITNSF